MDYEVFLCQPVDHHPPRGEDAQAGGRVSASASARIIAAAALIMTSVFASFILNGDPVDQAVRRRAHERGPLAAAMVLLLAPAILSITGKWAWWMPRFLERIVPDVDIEGTGLAPPEPAKAGGD